MIVRIVLVCSLRTTRGKTLKRPIFDWKKLQVTSVREQFQLELSISFQALQCNDTSAPITQRYHNLSMLSEKIVGKRKLCSLPSCVTDKTIQLKMERDEASQKRVPVLQVKAVERKMAEAQSNLNESYKSDEAVMLNKQMKDFKIVDSKGEYTTTWKIIHELPGKGKKTSVKVNKRDGAPPTSGQIYLQNGENTSVPCLTTAIVNHHRLWPSCCPGPTNPDQSTNTRKETLSAIHQMKTTRLLGSTVQLQLKPSRMLVMQYLTLPLASVQKFTPVSRHPSSGPSASLLKKGDLSQMTNYRGISLLSIRAKVYNKILFNRIRDYVDPILRKNQAGFRPGRSCAQQIHILRRIMEDYQNYQMPLTITFIDFKKAFYSIDREVMFVVLRHYGIPVALVNAIIVLYSNSKNAVLGNGNISVPFEVSTKVLQGDVWAPFLFIILVDYLMRKATSDLDFGVETHPRCSRRYPAKVLNDLDFADDIALLESTMALAQAQVTSTASAAKDLDLSVSKRVHDCKL